MSFQEISREEIAIFPINEINRKLISALKNGTLEDVNRVFSLFHLTELQKVLYLRFAAQLDKEDIVKYFIIKRFNIRLLEISVTGYETAKLIYACNLHSRRMPTYRTCTIQKMCRVRIDLVKKDITQCCLALAKIELPVLLLQSICSALCEPFSNVQFFSTTYALASTVRHF